MSAAAVLRASNSSKHKQSKSGRFKSWTLQSGKFLSRKLKFNSKNSSQASGSGGGGAKNGSPAKQDAPFFERKQPLPALPAPTPSDIHKGVIP